MTIYRATCKICGDELVSSNGQFVTCSCGEHFLDGDDYYYRAGGDPETLSEIEIEEVETPVIRPINDITWQAIVRKAFGKEEL
jgi:hypothetical protein